MKNIEQIRLRAEKDKAGSALLDAVLRKADIEVPMLFRSACEMYRDAANRLASYNESRKRR